MAAVQSTMQALGSSMPNFELPNVCVARFDNGNVAHENSIISSQAFAGKPVLVMFICNHCPFVVHVADAMASLANQAQSQGVAVIAISSNDSVAYPQDGPMAMASFAKQWGFEFPYLFDETQSVATLFKAACTPDFFLYDAQHALQYRGQLDGARPNNTITPSGEHLRAAIDSVLAGNKPNVTQTPSIGCNIKWRSENEPSYN